MNIGEHTFFQVREDFIHIYTDAESLEELTKSVEIVLKVVILFLIITVILAVDVFLLLTNFRIKETIERWWND